jgi:hypothetical protein
MKKPRELFLSHATPDRESAAALASTLRAHGVPVWFSRTNLAGAQQWHDEIGRALGRCDWFALLLSPAAVRSRWVKRELLFALRSRRYDCRIVPVLLRDCRWQQLVSLTSFVDGCRDPLAVWGLGLDPSCLTTPRRRGRKA